MSLVYKVIVEHRALLDMRAYAGFVALGCDRPKAAARWLSELESLVTSLDRMPKRFRVIDEQDLLDLELRQFVHYSHRVIYHVNDVSSTVHVLAVYHAHQDRLTPEDLPSEFL